MRQEIAFFDRPEHSTGTLTTMLSQEATAMAGLSGFNLGTIITTAINLTSVTILGYLTSQILIKNRLHLEIRTRLNVTFTGHRHRGIRPFRLVK